LPWSIWAIIEKFLMFSAFIYAKEKDNNNKPAYKPH
jgi:hypothetical protein